jgi:hypothetical protein
MESRKSARIQKERTDCRLVLCCQVKVIKEETAQRKTEHCGNKEEKYHGKSFYSEIVFASSRPKSYEARQHCEESKKAKGKSIAKK